MIFTLFFVLTDRKKDVKWANECSAWVSVCSNANIFVNYEIAIDLILRIYTAMHM